MLASKVIDEIELRLYEGSPSDDVTVEREQILNWASTVRDALVKEYLDSLIRANKPIESLYVERYLTATASEEATPSVNDDDERLYITLPKQPMTLLKDMGVIKVTTNEGFIVNRTRLEDIEVVTDLRYAKPTPQNMLWYRENKTVIIAGLYWKNIDSAEFTVSYIPTYTSQNLGETAEFVISDELLPELFNRVEEIAKRELYNSQLDSENDGVDIKLPIKNAPDSTR